jgi:hypothetical protein
MDWATCVSDYLAAMCPGAEISVSYGSKNAAFVDGEPLDDFADLCNDWWADECGRGDSGYWTEITTTTIALSPKAARAALAAAAPHLAAALLEAAEAEEDLDDDAEASAVAAIEALIGSLSEASQTIAGQPVSAIRTRTMIKAAATDLSLGDLRRIGQAERVNRGGTIVLPPGRYENLSRGKGWCRLGSGRTVQWASRAADGGWRVGPGCWTVGSTDGLSRKSQVKWTVRQIGDWTVAS